LLRLTSHKVFFAGDTA
jgi:superfamily I DNA/RNA helicase